MCCFHVLLTYESCKFPQERFFNFEARSTRCSLHSSLHRFPKIFYWKAPQVQLNVEFFKEPSKDFQMNLLKLSPPNCIQNNIVEAMQTECLSILSNISNAGMYFLWFDVLCWLLLEQVFFYLRNSNIASSIVHHAKVFRSKLLCSSSPCFIFIVPGEEHFSIKSKKFSSRGSRIKQENNKRNLLWDVRENSKIQNKDEMLFVLTGEKLLR